MQIDFFRYETYISLDMNFSFNVIKKILNKYRYHVIYS